MKSTAQKTAGAKSAIPQEAMIDALFAAADPKKDLTLMLPISLTGEEWAWLATAAQGETCNLTGGENRAADLGWALREAAISKFTLKDFASDAAGNSVEGLND